MAVEVARRCIAASTSERGCCPRCGTPWQRIVDIGEGEGHTLGWRPACEHDDKPVPCRVLDPFGGAGTTGLAARQLGRHATLIELAEAYCAMSAERLAQLSLLASPQRQLVLDEAVA